MINSNPATIMTDKDIADKVYIEPLDGRSGGKPDHRKRNRTVYFLLWEDRLALNLAMELEECGFLKEHECPSDRYHIADNQKSRRPS